jgi:hypothetical protein
MTMQQCARVSAKVRLASSAQQMTTMRGWAWHDFFLLFMDGRHGIA